MKAPVERLHQLEKRLEREQRKLSRKVKFSSNWKKQKQRIAKLSHRIANVRSDFLHKTTTAISKSHALVVLEDLYVKSMSKSARGTVNAPGRNVKAKAGLNRSILRQGWGKFRRAISPPRPAGAPGVSVAPPRASYGGDRRPHRGPRRDRRRPERALLDRSGAVTWLAWPRFDSPALCAAILDPPSAERDARARALA